MPRLTNSKTSASALDASASPTGIRRCPPAPTSLRLGRVPGVRASARLATAIRETRRVQTSSRSRSALRLGTRASTSAWPVPATPQTTARVPERECAEGRPTLLHYPGLLADRRTRKHRAACRVLPAQEIAPRRSRDRLRAGRWVDVLVDVEDVVGVVLRFDARETVVVVAVGCADAFLALVHHEVDVRPPG